MTAPAHRFLSLGAGVRSSTLLILACQGRIPIFDAAISADTGWEPAAVYRHLRKLTRLAETAGIPVAHVHKGHLRWDPPSPAHWFASMPFNTRPAGQGGMARRQCINEWT